MSYELKKVQETSFVIHFQSKNHFSREVIQQLTFYELKLVPKYGEIETVKYKNYIRVRCRFYLVEYILTFKKCTK